MRPLGGAIGRVLAALNLEGDVANAAAVLVWERVAAEVIGADAVRTEAIRIEKQTLVVTVPTAQWASEIRLRERELLRLLAKEAPGSRITHIRSVPRGE